jgi:hypothetical protein
MIEAATSGIVDALADLRRALTELGDAMAAGSGGGAARHLPAS